MNDLNRHEKSVHGKDVRKTKSYKCFSPDCAKGEKIWPRLDNFKQHLVRMHTAENFAQLLLRSEHWYEIQNPPDPSHSPRVVEELRGQERRVNADRRARKQGFLQPRQAEHPQQSFTSLSVPKEEMSQQDSKILSPTLSRPGGRRLGPVRSQTQGGQNLSRPWPKPYDRPRALRPSQLPPLLDPAAMPRSVSMFSRLQRQDSSSDQESDIGGGIQPSILGQEAATAPFSNPTLPPSRSGRQPDPSINVRRQRRSPPSNDNLTKTSHGYRTSSSPPDLVHGPPSSLPSVEAIVSASSREPIEYRQTQLQAQRRSTTRVSRLQIALLKLQEQAGNARPEDGGHGGPSEQQRTNYPDMSRGIKHSRTRTKGDNKKRRKLSTGRRPPGDDSEEEEGTDDADLRPLSPFRDRPREKFACQFYKHDPVAYAGCHNICIEIDTLYRHHIKDKYHKKKGHVDAAMLERLAGLRKNRRSPSERWEAIYNALFPPLSGCSKPPSPYWYPIPAATNLADLIEGVLRAIEPLSATELSLSSTCSMDHDLRLSCTSGICQVIRENREAEMSTVESRWERAWRGLRARQKGFGQDVDSQLNGLFSSSLHPNGDLFGTGDPLRMLGGPFFDQPQMNGNMWFPEDEFDPLRAS